MARYSKRSRWAHQYKRAYSRWHANKGKRKSQQSGKLFGLGLGKTYSAKGNGYFHKRHY